jgi:D-alanine transaminase
MSIVYLNGKFMPIEEACVPVLDRGFLFGDGVYEVIPVYGGQLFRLEQHLARLQDSLDAIRLQNPLSADVWEGTLRQLVNSNGGGELSVYLQVTRGPGRRDHAFPEHITPTVFSMCNPITPVEPEVLHRGVSVVTMDDIRWQHCNIKAITLLPNVLLKQQAIDAGASEAILVREGLVTEGTASNVFMVKDNTIITPPKDKRLLPGVTRDLVLELARAHSIACKEADIPVAALGDADEIWLSSSTREILPVTRLNGVTVGTGSPGPCWQKIRDIYSQYKESLRTG